MKHTWSWPFQCDSCGKPYPKQGFPYRCPDCGGIFTFSEPLIYDPLAAESARIGLQWYRKTFPIPEDSVFYSLGEGGTPLLPVNVNHRSIYFKCEHLNPTGSFKDRGTVVLISGLAALGVEQAVEDSSGNAGASFAAYAARAGIHAKVYIPSYAAGPKRAQIEAYGAELVCIPGPRSAASKAVRKAGDAGAVYASHAYLPHGLAGMATIAFEIVEQLGQAPGALIMPVGHGSLLLGAAWGFQAMVSARRTSHIPRLVAVQALNCAPLWAAHMAGFEEGTQVQEGETIAEGIRIVRPFRAQTVLSEVEKSGGMVVAVAEEEIVPGRRALAEKGLFVEPTSAVVWPALLGILDELPDPIVVVLTGTGLKDLRI